MVPMLLVSGDSPSPDINWNRVGVTTPSTHHDSTSVLAPSVAPARSDDRFADGPVQTASTLWD